MAEFLPKSSPPPPVAYATHWLMKLTRTSPEWLPLLEDCCGRVAEVVELLPCRVAPPSLLLLGLSAGADPLLESVKELPSPPYLEVSQMARRLEAVGVAMP